ncbi:ThiF family adenylyltransferase [Alginatibacterium sediminis]|uniref:ThiF family adenylyltransferase n=1 Tax=Alginatibacterium sediminis TaxID=2164068 RepID=A0A420E878_9ALTE|nr:ThiF family adenylyltransferase [Alginatibacterium sediminis]RKF14373.1 ThiF family adenylyltransferase [Alginatibacterium sediminis]
MFNYQDAFSRNIGWLTENEQELLRHKRVAIAGAGGVGSEHIVTLARLGIGKFNIADFDEYEVHNFNRQAGAFMSTVGKEKVRVMEQVALDINPEAEVRVFEKGIHSENIDEFLRDVDIYVDSLDFFALDARILVFEKCEQLGIPVVTAAPLGMGAAVLCFTPESMGFEQYFRFDDATTEDEKYIKFLVGLSPSMLQRPYLVDPSRADFKAKKGPSTPMAVKMCAGVAGSNVLKILLGRGKVILAPRVLHFDAYRNRLKITWRPNGNRSLMQRLTFNIAKKIVLK